MHPTVSVIVPSYRHADHLPMRLESVLNQTFQDFELIILDDASPDNSRDVIARYLRDPRVSFHPNETNSGSTFKQWAKGLGLARGEFVWIAESDDFAEPTFLKSLLELAQRHPTAGLLYCQSDLVDERSGFVRPMLEHYHVFGDPDRWRRDHFNGGRDEIASYLMLRNIIPNASACLFRRAALTAIGGPVVDYKLCGDWVTYARLLMVSDIAFCGETLNHFRLHPLTARRQAERALLESLETYRALSEMAQLAVVEPAVKAFAAALAFQRMNDLMVEQDLRALPAWENIREAAVAFDPDFARRISDPVGGKPQTATFYFADDGVSFTEIGSVRRLVPPGAPWVFRTGPVRGVPRLDPTANEGFGLLLRAVFRDPNGAELWRTETSNGFAGTVLAGTAARIADSRGLGFYAWGVDPIVLFPGFVPPDGSDYFIECEIIAGAPITVGAGS
jgi:hypothetical protein